MAESCVDNNRCGTYYPGWLSGSHPTVNEGAVQRRVCFRYYDNCCDFPTYIRVRNCGGFYVYQLKPLTYCYLRYCGNGYVSSTPTTPGTPFPSFCLLSCINFLFVLRMMHQAFIDERTNCLPSNGENERQQFQLIYIYPSTLSVFESFSAIHMKTLQRRRDDSIP